jgi:hypothetical protein
MLARSGAQATVGVGSVDPDTLYLQSNATLSTPTFAPATRTRWNSCGTRSFLRVTGGTLLEEMRDRDGKVSFEPPYSPDIQILTRYRVVKGKARFTLNGLRHEVSKGSEFSVWCVGLNALHRGKTFPALQLDKGAVRVSGNPRRSGSSPRGHDTGRVPGLAVPGAARHDRHAEQEAAPVDVEDAQGAHGHDHAVAAGPSAGRPARRARHSPSTGAG